MDSDRRQSNDDDGRIIRFRPRMEPWRGRHWGRASIGNSGPDGSPVADRQWADTVLIPPKQTVDVAFVADNPGDWMLHCHVMDHQTAGLMTVLRVA